MSSKLKNYKLVLEINELRKKSVPFLKENFLNETEYKKEQNEIINTCLAALADNKAHYCVSANQIGKNYTIGIVNITEPIILINPVLTINDETKKVPYLECNISLQNRLFITDRYVDITITADNLAEPLSLKYEGVLDQVTNTSLYNDLELMEIVFLQQLIDSMNGILPMDRIYIPKKTPIVNTDEKIQRNSLVTLIKDEKEIQIKYKKIDSFLADGWMIK